MLDACAAPGGKSTHLAELMEDQGDLWAVDRSSERLKRVRENAARLGITCINILASDATTLMQKKPAWLGYFQKILVDAPCSGLGTLARHPDARWRIRPERIQRLVALQEELLEKLLPLLSPGGRMVYSTCTIHPDENHRLIKRFVARHPELKIKVERQIWPDCEQGGDGFYAAALDHYL